MRKHRMRINDKYHDKENFTSVTETIKKGKPLAKLLLLIVPLYMLLRGNKIDIEWSHFQWVVALIIAVDVRSGVVTNAIHSYMHFFHTLLREKNNVIRKRTKNRILFTALHIHAIIVGLLYSHSIIWGVFWYSLLNFSAWLVARLPVNVTRAISIVIIIVAIMINVFIINPPMLFEWLVPMLFIKIVYNHTPRKHPSEAYIS